MLLVGQFEVHAIRLSYMITILVYGNVVQLQLLPRNFLAGIYYGLPCISCNELLILQGLF